MVTVHWSHPPDSLEEERIKSISFINITGSGLRAVVNRRDNNILMVVPIIFLK